MRKQVILISVMFLMGKLFAMKDEYFGIIEPITSEIAQCIVGKTWESSCPIPLSDLRYLSIAHWGYDGKIHAGHMIVHKNVAQEVIEIFDELFRNNFPIQKMQLVDKYFRQSEDRPKGVIDDESIADNNTSAFFFRFIGKTDIVSEHGLGTAIDINPQVNPFVAGKECWPESGRQFCDRTRIDVPGLITPQSICYKAFISHGWKWGGNWKNVKDYQHFCKKEIVPASYNE